MEILRRGLDLRLLGQAGQWSATTRRLAQKGRRSLLSSGNSAKGAIRVSANPTTKVPAAMFA